MSVYSSRHVLSAVTFTASMTALLALPVTAQYGGPSGPTTSVRGGAAGSEVVVSMPSGLAPSARVSMGFGGLSGGYELLGRAETTPEGGISVTLTVPGWAERNLVYFFFVNVGGGVRLFSDPFIVTAPTGVLQVAGSVSEVTDGCVVISGLDDTRYAITGVNRPVAVGSRVSVDSNLSLLEGELAAGSPCARPAIPVKAYAVRVAG
jgi:hypothetical protein